MRIEAGLDTGPYDEVVEVRIDDLSTEGLTTVLAEAGAGALLRTLARIDRGEVQWTRQDDAEATYAHKVTRADVTPNLVDDAATVLRKLRASGPQAAARVKIAGHGVTLVAARRSEEPVEPGMATVSREGVELGAADATVRVTRLKPDGKPEMDATAWARGARLGDVAEWEPS